jgi:hypothetical protein
MINRKRITYSSDNKKKKNLSNWIKDCELETYTTKELKEEIKDLLLDVVYDKDKDIREHFFNKYISEFSEILNEQSKTKNLDSFFNVPKEKNEFKLFIENRNRKLENSKKKIIDKYELSENKKIIKNLMDDDDINKSDFRIEKEKYNNLKKRDNSKLRDYIKYRNQMMNEYNCNYDYDRNNNKRNRRNESNKSKDNKKRQPLIINNRGYYDIPRLILNKNKKEESKKKINTNIINYPYDLEDILNKNINYNKNNINIIREKNLILNKSNFSEEKDLYNQLSNWEELNNKNRQTLLNELFLKETSCELNIDEKKNKENFELTDVPLEDNKDEIQKIIVNGFNYKITGDPKKVEIKEEIISDTKNLNLNEQEEKKENEEKSYYHRKIIIKKNLDVKDLPSNEKKKYDEEVSYIQKIEKDIRASETRIRNVNITKDKFKNIGKKLKQLFDNIGVIHINKSYEIIEAGNNLDNNNKINNKMSKDFIKKNSYSYEIKKDKLDKIRNKESKNDNDNIINENDLINNNIDKIKENHKNKNNDIINKNILSSKNIVNEEKKNDKINFNNENNKTKDIKPNASESKRKRFHRVINKK